MNIERARAFLDSWITENVRSSSRPYNDLAAKHLVARCVEAAEQQGISRAELESACQQGLVACMCDAQVAAADANIGDLMDEA
jgi:hypothetical protein